MAPDAATGAGATYRSDSRSMAGAAGRAGAATACGAAATAGGAAAVSASQSMAAAAEGVWEMAGVVEAVDLGAEGGGGTSRPPSRSRPVGVDACMCDTEIG